MHFCMRMHAGPACRAAMAASQVTDRSPWRCCHAACQMKPILAPATCTHARRVSRQARHHGMYSYSRDVAGRGARAHERHAPRMHATKEPSSISAMGCCCWERVELASNGPGTKRDEVQQPTSCNQPRSLPSMHVGPYSLHVVW